MTADNVSKEVAALLKQREQYRAFLVKLEERSGQANPRAYEAVKQDYEAKLKDLGAKLVKHVEAVRQALIDSETAVTDLEVRRDAKHEELEEARLRHSVGEYGDDKEWKGVERKLSKEFDDLEKQVEQKKAAVANLTEVLEQIEAESGRAAAKAKTQAKAAPKPKAAPETDAAATTGEPKEQRKVRQPGQQVSSETPMHGIDVGNLEELDLAAAPPPGRGDAGSDELKFLESLSLAPEPELEIETNEDEVAGGKPSSLSFLSKRAKGRTETVICPRCSAANDPAEWYCVECGEELPAG